MIWRAIAVACATVAAGGAVAETPLPFDVGGPYALVDHFGRPHTQADPAGNAQLLFFGYANCPGICSAALPMMGEVTDILGARGITVQPVMITVDPARDTVDTMAAPLSEIHPALLGLTGTPEALAAAYEAFSVDHALAYEDPEYGPVYSHGSLIYLMDAEGDVLTLLPPVLEGRQAADIALKYLSAQD
ncbi:photosynthetic protein synthase I [Sulfitobacter alexandrii]|uniref:Photosynthetic protein synthase I n=1 Tax=Sulfitobacter alexandrii TaxID=1917485 RepID=A0A1J0WEH6_9RHOB|nr:SCO family protein [Sulfitobacter alexandrii]APE42716.1 photosynthetic protein synthase I [Sulfitobacter alexandrii]